jgi:hypothetical protein
MILFLCGDVGSQLSITSTAAPDSRPQRPAGLVEHHGLHDPPPLPSSWSLDTRRSEPGLPSERALSSAAIYEGE